MEPLLCTIVFLVDYFFYNVFGYLQFSSCNQENILHIPSTRLKPFIIYDVGRAKFEARLFLCYLPL